MYMDAGSPHIAGDNAIILSKPYNPTSGSCLSFWYYMYGENVGTLFVIIAPVGQQVPLSSWTLDGDQGAQWNLAVLSIQSIDKFQVSGVTVV